MRTDRSENHTTHSERETFELARKLGIRLKGDEVILLQGELGAGKTVFARGLAAGLGIKDVTEVCSPSFTLVNVYQTRVPMYHMDLYRLGSKSDVYDLGWEDFLEQGVIVVEWAERMDYTAPAIKVTILVDDAEKRFITISEPLSW